MSSVFEILAEPKDAFTDMEQNHVNVRYAGQHSVMVIRTILNMLNVTG